MNPKDSFGKARMVTTAASRSAMVYGSEATGNAPGRGFCRQDREGRTAPLRPGWRDLVKGVHSSPPMPKAMQAPTSGPRPNERAIQEMRKAVTYSPSPPSSPEVIGVRVGTYRSSPRPAMPATAISSRYTSGQGPHPQGDSCDQRGGYPESGDCDLGHAATSFGSGRATSAGHSAPSGQLSLSHAMAFSYDGTLQAAPPLIRRRNLWSFAILIPRPGSEAGCPTAMKRSATRRRESINIMGDSIGGIFRYVKGKLP